MLKRHHTDQRLYLGLHSVPLGKERGQPRCLKAEVSSVEHEWRAKQP